MNSAFENPPLNEVIIGVYFDRPMMVRSEHIGVFWNSVRSEFPKIEQHPELLVPMSHRELNSFDLPTPRHWLIASDDETLMQIQPNAFLFNWRKREGSYPRYEKVKQRFDELLREYCRFMEAEFNCPPPGVRTTELTYSNLIEAGDYWNGPSDTAKVIPGFSIPSLPSNDSGAHAFSFVSAYGADRGVNIQLSLRTGATQAAPEKPILVLEFRALGQHGAVPISETVAWFDTAHNLVGDCFRKLTNPDIQKTKWKLT